ncbi:calvin cycle protein CP12-3, chloroplastic [Hevea brasiliensis]|uniref:calvin cycle protein CP12-3, chloroplastic n=1 Tax=Hevea brasiliensis TaxID=3981 RepID=UPI000B77CC60|nr:calvin cycle protein CP12-3, chloroplastic [Hevea brasiliensis]
MASYPFVTALSTPRRETSILPSSFSTPSDAYCKVFLDSLALKRSESKAANMNLRVRAMGGAPKFKGTQMREKQLTEMIEKKVMEAKEVCEGDQTSDECKVAWDEVEEVSQAKADFRLKLEKQDPLEYFCQDNPETDECRVYED